MIRACRKSVATILIGGIAGLSAAACQNPNEPGTTVNYSEALDITVDPDPIIADSSTGGKLYRVVRGNNQPDEMLAYDWHAVFTSSLVLNDKATDDDLDLDFPVRITGATLTVKQATGGIITPPSGSETEKFEYVPLSASSNQFAAINNPITLTFETWYDLPSLRKECVITLTYGFVDNDGTSFQRIVDFKVGP
jgi:hypothetical protein